MPPAIIAAAVGAAGAIGGAAISSSAAKKAANKASDATNQTIAWQQQALATQQANTAKARGAGDAALDALLQRFGLTAANQNAPSGPQVNYSQYVQQQPDVLANWNAMTPADKANFGNDMAAFGQWHHQETNRLGENRDVTPFTTQPTSTPATTPNLNPTRPTAPPRPGIGPAPTYTAPTYAPAPVYDAPDLDDYGPAPTYTAPELLDAPEYEGTPLTPEPTFVRPEMEDLDTSLAAYEVSPGYEHQMREASRETLARAAATGSLESGAAAKALQDRAQDIAYQDWQDFRDYTTSQHNVDRNVLNANFENDRATGLSNWRFTNQFNQNDNQFGAGLANSQWQYSNTFNQNNALNSFNAANGNYWNRANYDMSNAQFGHSSAMNAWNSLNALNTQNAQFGHQSASQNFWNTTNLEQQAYNTDRAYTDDIFTIDRQNAQSEDQRGIGNLLALAGLGQGATSQLNSATQQAAANGGNALLSGAAAQGNAALANAGMINNLINNGTSALAWYYGSQGGGGGGGGWGGIGTPAGPAAMKNGWAGYGG